MNRLTGRGNPTTWPRPYVEAGRHGLTTPDAELTAIDDVRLANEVDRILRATGYMPLRDLEVIAHDGIVSLSSHVPSYYMKQIAQSAALTVPELRRLDNELDVDSPR